MTSKPANTTKDASEAAAETIKIDVSDLLGVNQAFLPEFDAARQTELIDAYCNKIGSEGCCCC